MKTERNILIAFLLNLFFALFEFIGGAFTHSVAIMSDAVHDIGDAMSIGISWACEKKSRKQPNEKYTYGYARYSVLGSVITTVVLLVGSVLVIYNSFLRFFNPVPIFYVGMIFMGVFGVIVNFIAALVTRGDGSLNQKAVNLHMFEDVLGWIIVLIGAVVMHFTDLAIIDPIMSIAVAVFILIEACKNLKEGLAIFLEKTPEGLDVTEIGEHLKEIEGVEDVHHIHLWTMDGQNNYATLHAVTDRDHREIKKAIREEMAEHGISHVTVEIEKPGEDCGCSECHVEEHHGAGHSHHHHHH